MDGITPFESWSGQKLDVSHFMIFVSKDWVRIQTEKRNALEPKSKELLFFSYYKYSKGYNFIKISTQRAFIERSVQFEEEPMPATKIGESFSPPPPLTVSEEDDKFYDSDMSDNDDLIADPNTLTRPKWEANTIHAVGELAGNPSDPRRTRSQFESALYVKDHFFVEKCYIMIE